MDRIHCRGNRMYRNFRRNGNWIQIQVTKLLKFSASFFVFAVPREINDTVNIWATRCRTLDYLFHRTELGPKCSSWCGCREKLVKARILPMVKHDVKNYAHDLRLNPNFISYRHDEMGWSYVTVLATFYYLIDMTKWVDHM